MRSNAGTSYSNVGQIPAGSTFNVIGGPRCNDGYRWWQVNYNGTTGWTADGETGDLWIERVGSNQDSSSTVELIRHTGEEWAMDMFSDEVSLGHLQYEVLVTYSQLTTNNYQIRGVTVRGEVDPFDSAGFFCNVVIDADVKNSRGIVVTSENNVGLGIGLLFSDGLPGQVDLAIFEEVGRSATIEVAFRYQCAGNQERVQYQAEIQSSQLNLVPSDPTQLFFVEVDIP